MWAKNPGLVLAYGLGTKGERVYDWLCLDRNEINTPDNHEYKLLVRRSIKTQELSFYSALVPSKTSLEIIVKVAGGQLRNVLKWQRVRLVLITL